jgi:hypothetical protein
MSFSFKINVLRAPKVFYLFFKKQQLGSPVAVDNFHGLPLLFFFAIA